MLLTVIVIFIDIDYKDSINLYELTLCVSLASWGLTVRTGFPYHQFMCWRMASFQTIKSHKRFMCQLQMGFSPQTSHHFVAMILIFIFFPHSLQEIFSLLWTSELWTVNFFLLKTSSRRSCKGCPPYWVMRKKLISIRVFAFTKPCLPTSMKYSL